MGNSTAEFLIFSPQSGGDELEVRFEEETIWLTQKAKTTILSATTSTPVSRDRLNV